MPESVKIEFPLKIVRNQYIQSNLKSARSRIWDYFPFKNIILSEIILYFK